MQALKAGRFRSNFEVGMKYRFLSRFTPSLMPPDALEAIFVQREELLQDIMDRIRENVRSAEKQNTLLIGPRGIGKTHLISMIYYRLQASEELKDRVLIAWLREEEWGISCFRDLLLRILRSLLTQVEDNQIVEQQLKSIYALKVSDAEAAAADVIRELVGDRTLVLMLENLDEMLRKIGNVGEIQLHHFLQKTGFCCVIAASPGPAANVMPPGSPFYQNFFRTEQLEALKFEDAIQLISKIARYQGNKQLTALIGTPKGRARVRALRHLAGGNHRAYMIFAPLLTRESIGKLIKPLMKTIDDLTPYYNSRIAALPVGQRKIIEYVCEGRHPVRAQDVARSCFITPEMASVQLDALCRVGHLQSFMIKDVQYYELREPLMRLSIEVKKHRGKPIGLLLDFLRLWYSPAELKQRLAGITHKGVPEGDYAPLMKILEQDWGDPRIAECCRDYNEAVQKDDYDRALKAAEELVTIRGLKQDFFVQVSCLFRLGHFEPAIAVAEKMTESFPQDAEVWRLRASALNRAGRFEEALDACSQSIEVDPEANRSWSYHGSILLNLGRGEEALQSCDRAIKLNEKDPAAWTTRGMALADLNLFDEALAAFAKVVELEPVNAKAKVHLCAALIELKRRDEAYEQIQKAIEIDPQEPEAWVLKGSVLSSMKRYDESLKSFNHAVSLGENSAFVHFKIVELMFALDRWREGAAHLDEALDRFAHSDNPNAGDTGALIRQLLPSLAVPKVLQLSIKVLLLVYRKHGMLSALGRGLIECIRDVMSPSALTDADACLWRDTWQEMAEPYLEFRLPLRLLDSTVRYRTNQELEIFMDLTQEERALLEPLVGIHIEAIA